MPNEKELKSDRYEDLPAELFSELNSKIFDNIIIDDYYYSMELLDKGLPADLKALQALPTLPIRQSQRQQLWKEQYEGQRYAVLGYIENNTLYVYYRPSYRGASDDETSELKEYRLSCLRGVTPQASRSRKSRKTLPFHEMLLRGLVSGL